MCGCVSVKVCVQTALNLICPHVCALSVWLLVQLSRTPIFISINTSFMQHFLWDPESLKSCCLSSILFLVSGIFRLYLCPLIHQDICISPEYELFLKYFFSMNRKKLMLFGSRLVSKESPFVITECDIFFTFLEYSTQRHVQFSSKVIWK